MNYGFIRVASAIPAVKVADCTFNTQQTIDMMRRAAEAGVQIIVFPELGITGYSCGDLFAQQLLLDEAEKALITLITETADLPIIGIVGVPLRFNGSLYNCATVFGQGQLEGIVPKTYLPNYKEFYEKRWFASALPSSTTLDLSDELSAPVSSELIFCLGNAVSFAVEICEDVWAPIPPSSYTTLRGADIVFNLSADTENVAKHDYLKSLIAQQSSRTLSGYVFSSCGFGESTTDVVFAGNAFIYEAGKCLASAERFSFEPQLIISEIDVERLRMERRVNTTFAANQALLPESNGFSMYLSQKLPLRDIDYLSYPVDSHPFIPHNDALLDRRCEEVFSIQVAGLAKRLVHTNMRRVVIGISGGLDSTLALLVAVMCFDRLGWSRKGIYGITMPGFGTTDRTYQNALTMMRQLGVSMEEISIKEACIQHFEDIRHDLSVHDVTYENGQARERTQILMDFSNKIGGLVIGTGDMSELALGWATYNGDHMSMYGVNAGVPKTLVQYLVRWYAEKQTDEATRIVLFDVLDTPISPELIPADEQGNIRQKTEDIVGPYELHDFYLYYFVRFGFSPKKIFFLARQAFEGKYNDDTLKKWLVNFCRRFFAQQFKRSCLPDGPKVGSVALSPRGDWRMPSDASARLWLDEALSL